MHLQNLSCSGIFNHPPDTTDRRMKLRYAAALALPLLLSCAGLDSIPALKFKTR